MVELIVKVTLRAQNSAVWHSPFQFYISQSTHIVLFIPASIRTLVHWSLVSLPSASLLRLTAFWNCRLISSFFRSSFFLLFIKNQLILVSTSANPKSEARFIYFLKIIRRELNICDVMSRIFQSKYLFLKSLFVVCWPSKQQILAGYHE